MTNVGAKLEESNICKHCGGKALFIPPTVDKNKVLSVNYKCKICDKITIIDYPLK